MPRDFDIRSATEAEISDILAELSNEELSTAVRYSKTAPLLFASFVRKQFGRFSNPQAVTTLLVKELNSRIDDMREADFGDIEDVEPLVDWLDTPFVGLDAPSEVYYMLWRQLFGESYAELSMDPPILVDAKTGASYRPRVVQVLFSFFGRDKHTHYVITAGLLLLQNGKLLVLCRTPDSHSAYLVNEAQDLLALPLPAEVISAWGLRNPNVLLSIAARVGLHTPQNRARKNRR